MAVQKHKASSECVFNAAKPLLPCWCFRARGFRKERRNGGVSESSPSSSFRMNDPLFESLTPCSHIGPQQTLLSAFDKAIQNGEREQALGQNGIQNCSARCYGALCVFAAGSSDRIRRTPYRCGRVRSSPFRRHFGVSTLTSSTSLPHRLMLPTDGKKCVQSGLLFSYSRLWQRAASLSR